LKRPVLTGLLIASVVALIGLVVVMRSAVQQSAGPAPAAVKNITVTLDGTAVTLKDGVAERPAAPGSAAQDTVRIEGEPVMGDTTGDGKPDAALLIANDPGGSGTFYYAVLAVDNNGSYQATNAVELGDRIDPEGIEFNNGRFVYRFLERKPGEPLAAAPNVEKRVEITVDPKSNRISAAA
jgi:hypothetical protein